MINKKQLLISIAKDVLKSAVFVIIAIVVVIFAEKKIVKIADSLQEKIVLGSVLDKSNETSLKLREDFKIVGEKDKKIQAAFILADNILEFVGILESLAKQHSLTQTVKFSSPVPVPNQSGNLNLASIDYNIVLNGNVSTLASYIKDFEKLPYFSGISSITLNATPAQGWNDNSSIFIQAKLYVKDIGAN